MKSDDDVGDGDPIVLDSEDPGFTTPSTTKRAASTLPSMRRYLSRQEAADYLGFSLRKFQTLGIDAYRVGRQLSYTIQMLDAFMAERLEVRASPASLAGSRTRVRSHRRSAAASHDWASQIDALGRKRR